MDNTLRVLVVEDSPDDALMLLRELRRGGYEPVAERVMTADAFRSALREGTWDAVIADWHLPNFSAPAALAILKESGLDLPFLIMSGFVGEAEAVAALKAGAHDFIGKANPARLIPAVERELREANLRRRNRQLEQALEQSEKMEMIGRFAGHVAGEFQRALARIGGACGSLLAQLPRDGVARSGLEEIQQASEHAGLLTLQLLALSRGEPAQPELVDLNSTIGDRYEMLRHIVGKRVHLSARLEPCLGKVNVDRSHAEQLVLNLIVNARDLADAGARIVIETGNAELDSTYAPQFMSVKPGQYIALSVANTGRGIEPDAQGRIFEPFFAAEPKGPDAGLGMALVYNIVKKCGGDIRVESEQKRGTTITVLLPRAGEPEAAARPSVAPGTGARPTVLLVEDDEEARSRVEKALSEGGYHVLEAHDGRAARLIGRSYSGPIDLLLTPAVLADVSGGELARELTRSRPGMKVLYACASGDPGQLLTTGGRTMVDPRGPVEPLVGKVRDLLNERTTARNDASGIADEPSSGN